MASSPTVTVGVGASNPSRTTRVAVTVISEDPDSGLSDPVGDDNCVDGAGELTWADAGPVEASAIVRAARLTPRFE